MIEKLHNRVKSHTPIDIMRWMNFTVFDITGDLAFDESFDSLKNENYNTWIANMFNMMRAEGTLPVLKSYPIIGVPVWTLLSVIPSVSKAKHLHNSYTSEKTSRRLNKKTDRKDFIR